MVLIVVAVDIVIGFSWVYLWSMKVHLELLEAALVVVVLWLLLMLFLLLLFLLVLLLIPLGCGQ